MPEMREIKKQFLSLLVLLTCVLTVLGGEASVDGLVSTKITRTFYLTKRVVKVTLDVKIKSVGEDISGFEYIFSLPEDQFSRVGFISAGGSMSSNTFGIERIVSERAFKIGVGDISQDEKMLFVEYHMGNSYSALPRSIRLGENQLLVFEDELRLRNKYKVTNEKIVIKFLAGTIIERTVPASMRFRDNKIVHQVGQDEQDGRFLVHFSLNNHLVYFDSVSRTIEISHWGNVKVREEYSGANMAAHNKGEFHRKEIMILSGQGFARMRSPGTALPHNTHVCLFVDHILPYRAVGLEYYDQIGNISYSNAWKVGTSHTILQIQPRSPLMGGWQFDYTVEYNLPLETVVFYDQDLKLYMLNLTMVPSAKGIYSENVSTQIRFPTGSSDISIDFPANKNIPSLVQNEELGHYFGWLDIFKPRPVLVYNMSSYFIPEHLLLNYKFQAHYRIRSHMVTFSGTFLISFLVLIPFLAVISIKRLNKNRNSTKTKQD